MRECAMASAVASPQVRTRAVVVGGKGLAGWDSNAVGKSGRGGACAACSLAGVAALHVGVRTRAHVDQLRDVRQQLARTSHRQGASQSPPA